MHYNRLAWFNVVNRNPSIALDWGGQKTVVYDILDGYFGICHALFGAQPLALLEHTFAFQIGPQHRDGQVKSPIDCQCCISQRARYLVAIFFFLLHKKFAFVGRRRSASSQNSSGQSNFMYVWSKTETMHNFAVDVAMVVFMCKIRGFGI